MKITIRHSQDSIDPSAQYSDPEFETVRCRLEALYEKELKKIFPTADIIFIHEQDTYAMSVSDPELELNELEEAEDTVQRTLESVFDSGTFWL